MHAHILAIKWQLMPKKQAKAHASAREVQQNLRGGRRRLAAVIALLIVLPLVVYGRVVAFDFVNYDDWQYVTKNPRIADGLTADNVVWAFTTVEMSNWHPLTYLSYLLDGELFGVRSGAFHAVNLLFHVANTLLLFVVLRRMTGAEWQSALVAALFAIHPQHVESVAWVSERKDVLSVFFGLLALGSYVNYARRGSWKWYVLALILFACSLLSKPTLVTFPCLLLLLDWWPLGRSRSRNCGQSTVGTTDPESSVADETTNKIQQQSATTKRPKSPRQTGSARRSTNGCEARGWASLVLGKVPFFLLALGFSIVAVFAQGDAVSRIGGYGLAPRIGNALVAYGLYVVRLFWPVGLAVMYPHPGTSIPMWQIAVAVLFLSAATGTVVVLRKSQPYLIVGWFWFLGTMVPMIGIVQVGLQQMADRYAYFPLIGLYWALTWGIAEFAARHRRRVPLVSAVAAAGVLALAITAWIQVGFWRNGETLFRRALDVTTKNPIAHINLAQALHDDALQNRDGKNLEEVARNLDEAIDHYREALRLDDRQPTAHKNLAQALSSRSQLTNGRSDQRTLEAAIHHYRAGLRLEPNAPDNDTVHFEVGNLLADLGRFPEAAAEYRQALELSPDYAAAHLYLGRVLADQNRYAQAIEQHEQALGIEPGWSEAIRQLARVHQQFGSALASQGSLDDAIRHFRQSLELRPSSASGHFLLARALAQAGQPDEAVAQFTLALERRPDSAEAHYELGLLLLQLGRRDAAIHHLREAVRLKPEDSEARRNLERALSEAK